MDKIKNTMQNKQPNTNQLSIYPSTNQIPPIAFYMALWNNK